jgi:hypothetical protein
VNIEKSGMYNEAEKDSGKNMKAQTLSWVRASISFPPSLYQRLGELAEQKKVSLAWVVRDAAEKYIAGEPKQGRGTRYARISVTAGIQRGAPQRDDN